MKQNAWIRKSEPSFWAEILIASDYKEATSICRKFVFDVGLCVTVQRAKYVYTGGTESGVIVRLINYPRFPLSPEKIIVQAEKLGFRLAKDCHQGSFTILTSNKTIFHSRRGD